MEIKRYLKDLMLENGISGYEGDASRVFANHARKSADEVYCDKIGNVICKVKGTQKDTSLKVMVFSHIDSLGFVVSRIDDQGFVFVDRLGGIPEKVLPGLRLSIRTIEGDYIPGVFGVKSHHATSADEKYKVDVVTSMYIDVGAGCSDDVTKLGVRIGCPVVYEPSFTELIGNRIAGTFVDNRAGCACLLGILDNIKKKKPLVDVYVVATTFEEFNLRGGMMAAREIKPDFAICLDVTLAGDTPETRSRFNGDMGKGPTVTLYNFHGRGTLNGNIAHEGLYKLALRCAEQMKIPLQEYASTGMLSDAAYVQFENGYIPCIDLGFPTRYTHTPVETCDIDDLEKLADLTHNMLLNINADLKRSRYEI